MTWWIPRGARNRGESAVDAALRESYQEAHVPTYAIDIVGQHLLDLDLVVLDRRRSRRLAPFDPMSTCEGQPSWTADAVE